MAAARANAARNGLAARVRVAGEMPSIEDGAFDLIVANITADVLQRLAGDLVSRLAAGGALVLSGMLADLQSDEVGAVYEALGCRRAASRVEGGSGSRCCSSGRANHPHRADPAPPISKQLSFS